MSQCIRHKRVVFLCSVRNSKRFWWMKYIEHSVNTKSTYNVWCSSRVSFNDFTAVSVPQPSLDTGLRMSLTFTDSFDLEVLPKLQNHVINTLHCCSALYYRQRNLEMTSTFMTAYTWMKGGGGERPTHRLQVSVSNAPWVREVRWTCNLTLMYHPVKFYSSRSNDACQ